MGPSYTVIDFMLLLFLFVPQISCGVGLFCHRELALSQAGVTIRVPRVSARLEPFSVLAEVGAEYPVHLLYRKRAFPADPFPIPPTTAFFEESKGFC